LIKNARDVARVTLGSNAPDVSVDINIVAANGLLCAGEKSQCYVVVAGSVALECHEAVGRIVAAGCIGKERAIADSCAVVTGGIAVERAFTDRRV
jgi:hypothetical protein